MDSSPNTRMVDTSEKPITARQATAKGRVTMQTSTLNLLKEGKIPKGDVLATARIAGIMAAKETHNLIPLCHPLLIDNITIEFSINELPPSVAITATVKGSGRTGFEMEALTAIAISALTIYDMCKPEDSAMHLENIRLTEKSGGKSGTVVLD